MYSISFQNMTRKPGYQKRERIKSMKINAYMIASDVERMFMQIYQVLF